MDWCQSSCQSWTRCYWRGVTLFARGGQPFCLWMYPRCICESVRHHGTFIKFHIVAVVLDWFSAWKEWRKGAVVVAIRNPIPMKVVNWKRQNSPITASLAAWIYSFCRVWYTFQEYSFVFFAFHITWSDKGYFDQDSYGAYIFLW